MSLPATYSNKCRIGNWSEEISYEQAKLEDLRSKGIESDLEYVKFQKKIEHNVQKVPLSYNADNLLRSGDHVMLYNCKNTGVLLIDVSDKVHTVNAGEFAFGNGFLQRGSRFDIWPTIPGSCR
eukprot:369351_1